MKETQSITVRAVCIGLFFSVILNLILLYSDFYLENTFLFGNHFPVGSLAVLIFLVLGFNVVARGWFKSTGLAKGELLLIWGMLGVAGGIGSAGFMRYLPGWMAAPAYLATPSNGFNDHLLNFLPSWMVLSHDPKDTAAKWFFEGLPAGAVVPWRQWLRPLFSWFLFGAALYAALFSLTSLFFQQWVSRERLTFALIRIPLDLAEEAEPGKLLNGFLRNPLTWVGAALPITHNLVNGLHKYFPAVPVIPFAWPGSWFTDRPWSEFTLGSVILYYSIVGLSFLLTTEMSFSIWFFYILYRLSFVLLAWMGTGATGFWGDWETQVGTFESSGAVLVLAGFLFWTARKFLAEWLGRVLKGGRDPEADPIHPRLAMLLMLSGFGGMVLWICMAGASPWLAFAAVALFLCVVLVLTRIVAEAGMLNVGTGVGALALVTGLVPPALVSGATVTALVMLNGAVMSDLQCIVMPYLMNGLNAARQARLPGGKVMLTFALVAVVAFWVGAYGHIATGYKFGAANLDKLGSVWTPQWGLPTGVNYLKNPPVDPAVTLGGVKLLPSKAMHAVVGALATGAMLFMRARFLGWPLHPLGLVICTQVFFSWIWFSIFLGWACKASVMSFGGASVYRKVLPFFLGMVLGEYLIAAVWALVSFAVGAPGYNLLMHW